MKTLVAFLVVLSLCGLLDGVNAQSREFNATAATGSTTISSATSALEELSVDLESFTNNNLDNSSSSSTEPSLSTNNSSSLEPNGSVEITIANESTDNSVDDDETENITSESFNITETPTEESSQKITESATTQESLNVTATNESPMPDLEELGNSSKIGVNESSTEETRQRALFGNEGEELLEQDLQDINDIDLSKESQSLLNANTTSGVTSDATTSGMTTTTEELNETTATTLRTTSKVIDTLANKANTSSSENEEYEDVEYDDMDASSKESNDTMADGSVTDGLERENATLANESSTIGLQDQIYILGATLGTILLLLIILVLVLAVSLVKMKSRLHSQPQRYIAEDQSPAPAQSRSQIIHGYDNSAYNPSSSEHEMQERGPVRDIASSYHIYNGSRNNDNRNPIHRESRQQMLRVDEGVTPIHADKPDRRANYRY